MGRKVAGVKFPHVYNPRCSKTAHLFTEQPADCTHCRADLIFKWGTFLAKGPKGWKLQLVKMCVPLATPSLGKRTILPS